MIDEWNMLDEAVLREAVELPPPGGRGSLVSMSVAGFSFQIDADPAAFEEGVTIENVELQIGECLLEGDVKVCNTRRTAPDRIEVGCMFFPTMRDEDRWRTLLAGIEVAKAVTESRS